MSEPTIFALSSGVGRSAVALVRVSGPAARAALLKLAGRLPRPRLATLAALRDGASGAVLDRALVLWFPGPDSFTGEDTVELHVHGGRAVVGAVLDVLSRFDGLRPAEPGEFTRRAFRNGKMGLAEVEALADLIEAETEAQRRQALHQFDGALGRWVEALRADLLIVLALAEAAIDFADEGDLVTDMSAEIRARVEMLGERLLAQLTASRRGEKLREGLVVTISGPPNVGKSTLINALAGRDVAIVSAHAGTTRDAIEVDLDLGGYAVRLIDTAGVRDTEDPVEQQGIARARARAAAADLVLWLDDGTAVAPKVGPDQGETWTVGTKADEPDRPTLAADFNLSAKTGVGLDILLAALADHAAGTLAGGETALVTRVRHRQALEQASRCLARCLAHCQDSGSLELVAEDLRQAGSALSTLVGSVETEEVLGTIFARFCVGK